MNLRDLQRRFEAALRGTEDAAVLEEVLPAGTLTSPAAVDVYGTSYRARLTAALGEIFETVWQALGDEEFFSAAESYIAEHPSSTHSLQFYGREFPEFLAKQSFPAFLKDLARFEWLFAELFHKPAAEGLDAPALAEAVESGTRLALVESAFLFESPWAVDALFEHRGSDHRPSTDVPAWLVVHKIAERIHIQKLDAEAFRILTDIQGGMPAMEALDRSNASESDVETLFAFIASHRLLLIKPGS